LFNYVANKFNDILFETEVPGKSGASVLFTGLMLAFLYGLGVFHWVVFLDFGDISVGHTDWGEQFFFFRVLTDSISNLDIPYFAPSGNPFFGDRFLGNLQAPFSPQVLLLPLMSINAFIVFNTLLLYSAGFLGCLLLRKRFGLSLIPFTFLFLLFNFNGHITSHLGFGHPWFGYFLLPFYLLLVLELVRSERANRLRISIMLAFVLFGILLQGSFHIFLSCSLFLLILGLFNRRLLTPAVLAIVFSASLSLFRLLPAALFYGGIQRSYASGFPTIPVFIDALTTIKSYLFEHPRPSLSGGYDVGWWEHDHFIGFVGVGFIAIFGIYGRYSMKPEFLKHRFTALDVPILLVVLFSFGIFFDFVSDLRIPFVSWAERVPSRFFVLPLLFLVVLSCIRLQEYLPKLYSSVTLKVLTVASVLQLTHSLAVHSWFWRVPARVGSAFDYRGLPGQAAASLNDRAIPFQGVMSVGYRVAEINLPVQQHLYYSLALDIGSLSDRMYTLAFDIGVVLSLLSLVGLGCLFYWKGRWRE